MLTRYSENQFSIDKVLISRRIGDQVVYFYGDCFGDFILYIDIFWFLSFLSKDNALIW